MTRLNSMGAGQWLNRRHTQVLNHAYQAAQEIRILENQYCQGQPITDEATIGKTLYDYVRSLCDRKLLTIRSNLIQFKVNSFLLGQPSLTPANEFNDEPALSDGDLSVEQTAEQTAEKTVEAAAAEAAKAVLGGDLIQKLSFIESVISRYRDPLLLDTAGLSAQMRSPRPTKASAPLPTNGPFPSLAPGSAAAKITDPALLQVEIAVEDLARPGLLGSFSLNRKQTEQYEQKVVQELRQKRQQSKTALRWLAILG